MHWAGEPGSIDLTWGAAQRFQLVPKISGPDPAAALDLLLTRWREHLAEVPAAANLDDTAAIVTWPSRDVDGIRVLQRHGLVPLAVIAARHTNTSISPSTGTVSDPARADGVRIRRAGPDDVEAVAALGYGLVRYDAYFGAVVDRPGTRAALRREAEGLLSAPEPWVWLAERDGSAVGLLAAERPEKANWIAPLIRLSPAAYLQQGFVLPGERGTGIGARLTATFHAEVAAAGVPVTLLHYSQVNPLSAPFWSQQGYRPLWTSWEARPAHTLR